MNSYDWNDEKNECLRIERGITYEDIVFHLAHKRIPDFSRLSARYSESARATLRKNKRVNIRMAECDLVRFQKTAAQEGLPYQTLISSILHKFINGRRIEKTG